MTYKIYAMIGGLEVLVATASAKGNAELIKAAFSELYDTVIIRSRGIMV